jgi:two-component system, chemotaxis family, sensor kinase Cph1
VLPCDEAALNRPRLDAEARESGVSPRTAELGTSLMHALDEHALVACADGAGRITFANSAFCRASQRTRHELLGEHVRSIDAGLQPPELQRAIWETISRGESWRGELRGRAKDGSAYWVAATVAPLATGSPGERQYVLIAADITQAKLRSITERSRERAELERGWDAQYAHAASHDLQEPIRAIVSCGQLLQTEYAANIDETMRQLIDHMVDGGQRMQRLVLGLLAYSRLGTQAPRLVPVSSREALQQAAGQLKSKLQETGASIDVGELPSVLSDPPELVQLFYNLLSNALEYRAERSPVIQVSAALDGDCWRFSVADNGIGIEERSFARIFALFQRLHTRARYDGTGLGLSMCKKIVERHGGRIWVESESGRGATFHFTLAAHGAAPSEKPE